jgi:hypothetical protein
VVMLRLGIHIRLGYVWVSPGWGVAVTAAFQGARPIVPSLALMVDGRIRRARRRVEWRLLQSTLCHDVMEVWDRTRSRGIWCALKVGLQAGQVCGGTNPSMDMGQALERGVGMRPRHSAASVITDYAECASG